MLEKNTFVVYGDNGVCQIVDKRKEKFAGQFKEYYILKPANHEASTFYVPVDNEHLLSKIRTVLSKEEILDLIRSVAGDSLEWIDDNRVRNETYREIFNRGDSRELLLLLKSLHLHRQARQEEGKKLWTVDETAMKHAEKLIYEEFATVLEIQEDEVVPYIMDIVQTAEVQEA